MPYSDEELSTAVEKIVRSSIRYSYDDLGVRKTGTSFGDLQDAAAGMFLARDGAPFYVVRLARDRLLYASSTIQAFLSELIRLASAVGRNVSPVTKTRSLNNAKVALDALNQATAQRTGVYENIENIPAFLRFERNTDKFLQDEGQKLNNRGDIVETPAKARQLLRPSLREFREEYDELLRLVRVLKDSIPNFQALNLPSRLSQAILSSSSSVLAERIGELEERTPEERLTVLRDVVLDVLAARSAVRGFGSLQPPTTFVPLEGAGTLFADALHPASPARLAAQREGGYAITESKAFLTFLVDGTYTVADFNPPGSFTARLDLLGVWNPPREVFTDQQRFDILRVNESGTTTYPVTLSTGKYTPTQFLSTVNSQVNLAEVEVILDFTQPKTSDEVLVSGSGPANVAFTGPAGVDYAALGVLERLPGQPGDLIFVETGVGARSVYFVTAVAANIITATRTLGSSSNGATVRISVGAAESAFPAIRLVDDVTAVSEREDLQVVDRDPGTLVTIGLANLARARSSRTSARLVQDGLNVSSTTFVAGVPRLTAEVEFVPDLVGTQTARSHPEDPSSVSLYLYRGSAQVISGTEIQLLDDLPDGLDAAQKAVIIRGAPDSADIDNYGPVTAVTGPFVSFAPAKALTASPGDVLEVEVGWDIHDRDALERLDWEVQVVDTFAGTQRYQVTGFAQSPAGGFLPFQLILDHSIPNFAQPGNQPLFFEATLGRERVVFISESTLTDSKVEAFVPSAPPDTPTNDFPAQNVFFTSDPASAVGTTTWLKLPEVPKRLEPGDTLEFHFTAPSSPDLTRTVLLIEEENNLIQLTESVPLDLANSLNFSNSSSVPFVRIRKHVKQNFDDVAEQLEEWLGRGENNALSTFRNLDAALNSLLVNENPTSAQIGTFRSRLNTLAATVQDLGSILMQYNANTVDEVDTLIKSFRAKGADRAVDLLLEGDFQAFFGLDRDEASYAGNVQKASRAVQREDFPVRRFNRENFDNIASEALTAQYDDVDFGSIMEDADPLENVSIPELNDQVPSLPVP